ncbi:MAG: FadR/GntR family transcriptional regulator [Oribacterium sp.]|jgi:GntR family transcriptional repressor for pyruvate dehydrogenase complex|nr:FadR/GntR family transcriptional regulator [Oribacterium sp.]
MANIHYKSLPEKTADLLSDYLYQQNFRSGEKLPGEIVLAKQFDVSRNTIRSAIKILKENGTLEVQRGSGTFMAARKNLSSDPLGLTLISDKQKLGKDLIDVRLMVEPKLAALAAEYATPFDIKNLEEICNHLETAAQKGDSYFQHDITFHNYIAGCSHNLVIHSFFPAINQGILLQEHVTQVRLKDTTIKMHRRIFQALKNHHPSEAEEAMTLHLLHVKERF